MRALRNLAIFLGVLILVLIVLDVAAVLFVENRIEREVSNAEELEVGSVDATVRSFPFLGRLAASGEVDHFKLKLEDLQTDTIPLASFTVEVNDVVFDRSNLMNSRVEIDAIGEATVAATIDEETASEIVGVPVTFTEGTVSVEVGGQTLAAGVDITDGVISLSVASGSLPTIAIPESDYLPCSPDATVEEGQIELSCTSEDLPPIIEQAIGRASIG